MVWLVSAPAWQLIGTVGRDISGTCGPWRPAASICIYSRRSGRRVPYERRRQARFSSNGEPIALAGLRELRRSAAGDGDTPTITLRGLRSLAAQGAGKLLRSDVDCAATLNRGAAWVAAHADLRQALGRAKKVNAAQNAVGRRGTAWPHLVELADGLRASTRRKVRTSPAASAEDWLAAWGIRGWAEADIDDDAWTPQRSM